jgi:hypothetical protein
VVDGLAGSVASGWLADREEGWLSAIECVALYPVPRLS